MTLSIEQLDDHMVGPTDYDGTERQTVTHHGQANFDRLVNEYRAGSEDPDVLFELASICKKQCVLMSFILFML
jgi:hypothetical protein